MAFWDSWFGKKRPGPGAAGKPAVAAAPQPPPTFPYPLVSVAGPQALAEWERLRVTWRPEGACPVLLGDREEVDRARAALEGEETRPEGILRAAATRTPEAFFEERLKEQQESLELDAEIELKDGLIAPRGEWPASPSPHTLDAHADIVTGKPKATVYIARIPTARPWEVFAYLGYGAWNDCPAPEDHVAAHRRWHERHGAEVYAVAGDVVECWVPRPPQDRDGAAALAREQYLYCADIVDQGTGTLLNLAGALKGAPAWFFWWD